MNICHIIWNIDLIGGAEKMVLNIAESIVKSKEAHNFSIISICDKDKKHYHKKLKEIGVPVYYLNLKICKAYNPLIMHRLLKMIRTISPDIIHSHLWGASFHGFLCAKFLAKPIIVHEHNVLKKRKWYWNAFDRLTLRYRAKTIACSSEVYNSLIDNLCLSANEIKKIEIIENCIDKNQLVVKKSRLTMRTEMGIDKNDFVFINVASLTEQKAHKYLVEAFLKLIRKHENVRLLLVGDGILRDEIERSIARYKIAERICLLGIREDIPDLLNTSDAFLLPSLWEGLPISLLEAMYMKLPVIVSNVGVMKSMVTHNVTAILVEPGNIEDLYDKMNYLLLNQGVCNSLGMNGQELVKKNYTMCQYTENLLCLYKRVIIDS